jgi:hypothetical protein
MTFVSLAAFLALTAGARAPVKIDGACCDTAKVKAPAEVVKANGYICALTGEVLPRPNCCPANAKAAK